MAEVRIVDNPQVGPPARVLTASPVGTEAGLVVRLAGGAGAVAQGTGAQVPVQAAAVSLVAGATTVTLPGAVGKFTYVAGFAVTGAGATAASGIQVVLSGIAVSLTYFIIVPAGAVVSITPLVVEFSVPIPSAAVNTAIMLTVPSFGAGNLAAASSIHGFQA